MKYELWEYSRLFIAVREDVPDFIVPTLVAHTILNADDNFKNNSNYLNWKKLSFKKVVVRVNQREFNKINSSCEKVFFGREYNTCDGEAICAIALPVLNKDLPNVLKYAKLWKPNGGLNEDNYCRVKTTQ